MEVAHRLQLRGQFRFIQDQARMANSLLFPEGNRPHFDDSCSGTRQAAFCTLPSASDMIGAAQSCSAMPLQARTDRRVGQ